MFNKKVMIIAIFLISLLAISAANAQELNTGNDVASEEIAIDNNLMIKSDDAVSAPEVTDNILSNELTSDNTLEVSESDKVSTHIVTGNTFDDIQNAVDKAKDGHTIELSGNYTKIRYGITIDKSLTIIGNGKTILDSTSYGSVFMINSGNINVKLINLSFINSGQSAIHVENVKSDSRVVDCLDCTFINNHFYGSGCALSYGNAVNCTFINNYASGAGGAIYHGDAINCIFINNSAWGGGAISNGNAENCIFINNSAYYDGGAIDNGNAVNCIFNGNYIKDSYGDGGGAINDGKAENCTFINNSAWSGGAIANGEAENCTFINNSGYGIFYNSNALNCTFRDNRGRAIECGDATNCIFIHNAGGAIYDGQSVNCTFINNYNIYDGGAINYGTAVNCIFINNTAKNGGAMSEYGSLAVNCTFIGNSATECGGAMDTCDAINCTFIGNTAKKGGALSGSEATTCKFINNTADECQAMYGGVAKYCIFKGNEKPDSDIVYCNGKFILSQNGRYYKNKKLSIKLMDTDSDVPIANEIIRIIFSNGKSTTVETNSQGVATYSIPFEPGTYAATVSLQDNDQITIEDGELDNIEINKIPCSLKVVNNGNYYKGTELVLTLTNLDSNTPMSGEKVDINFSNGESATVTTDSKGIATYSIPFKPGTYSVTAKTLSSYLIAAKCELKNIEINKLPLLLTPTQLSTTYASGKYFQVKVIDSNTKNAISNIRLTLKVYTGSKFKTAEVTTGSDGIAKYLTSSLSVGTHKVAVSIKDTDLYTGLSKTSSIKVSKSGVTITAPKQYTVFKKGPAFKVTVKNKVSKKAVSGIAVTVKMFTGKKYKTLTAKTNSKGEATFSTKSLSKKSHVVKISTKANAKYLAGSAKSSITVLSKKITTTMTVKTGVRYNLNGIVVTTATVTLKDAYGHTLVKPIKVSSFRGTTTEKSGSGIPIRITGSETFTFRFMGDSLYKASQCSEHFSL